MNAAVSLTKKSNRRDHPCGDGSQRDESAKREQTSNQSRPQPKQNKPPAPSLEGNTRAATQPQQSKQLAHSQENTRGYTRNVPKSGTKKNGARFASTESKPPSPSAF